MMKFPPAFTETNGGYQSLSDDQDEYYKQLLSVISRTEPGTHPLTPDYGVQAPTFKTVDRGQLLVRAGRYVPEIKILSVENFINEADGLNELSVSFMQRS